MESPCTDFTLKGHMEIKDLLKNILNLKVQYVVLEEEILSEEKDLHDLFYTLTN